MKRARWIATLAVGWIMVVACTGEAAPRLTADPNVANALALRDPAGFRYTCGGFAFDAAILGEDGTDERAATPEAAALRKYLATPAAKADALPETGWHLIGRQADFAQFVTKGVEGDEAIVRLATVEDGWRVGAGLLCRAQLVLPDGVGIGSWTPDPDAPVMGPRSRFLRLLVQEEACASGKGPIGRIVGPSVLPAGNQVFVVFGVLPLPGGQTCQRVPPGKVEIDLGDAIGERQLIDPSFWPPFVQDVA